MDNPKYDDLVKRLHDALGYAIPVGHEFQSGERTESYPVVWADADFEIGDGTCGLHVSIRSANEPAIPYIRLDQIEALQAEQCAVVNLDKAAFDVSRLIVEWSGGAWEIPMAGSYDVACKVAEHITLRPVSEVQAEAHAAAIEAAAERAEADLGIGDDLPPEIRALHTDASRAYLAERDERIKREAREEALREAYVAMQTFAPHQEDIPTGPEHDIGYAGGYHTAMDRVRDLIEKGASDA